MSVPRTKARASPEDPRDEVPYEIIEKLNGLANETCLDLDGMAAALWAMAFADRGSGCTNTPMFEALHWMQRELDRKSKHILDVSHEAAMAIRHSQSSIGRDAE